LVGVLAGPAAAVVTDFTVDPSDPVMGETVEYAAVDDGLYPPPDTYKWEYKYTSGSCQQDWVEGSTASYVVFIESRPGTWDVRLTATYAQDSSGDPPHAPSVITKSVTIAPATHFTVLPGCLDTPTLYTSSILLKFRVEAASRPCGHYICYLLAQESLTDIWCRKPPFTDEYPADVDWTPNVAVDAFHLEENEIWDTHSVLWAPGDWSVIGEGQSFATLTQALRLKYTDPCNEIQTIDLGSHHLTRVKVDANNWKITCP